MKKLFVLLSLVALFIIGCNKNNSTRDDNVIKIGVIGALTGNVAQYGNSTINGFKLKVDEINENGGINGRKIELIIADSKGDAQESINIFKKMVSQDKIDLLFGEITSGPSVAISTLAQEAKIPMITPTGTVFDITLGKDYVFRTTYTDPYQGTILAKYIIDKGYKDITVLTNTANDYAVGLSESFIENAKKAGLNIIEEKYNNDDRDFRALLTKVKSYNSEIVFIPDYYNIIGLILTQAKEVGLDTQFVGGDGWDGVQTDFATVAEGGFFSSQFAPNDPSEIVQNFISSFRKKYNEDPIIFSALGYDTGIIIEEALKNVSDLSNKQEIRDAINNVKNLELVTGSLVFDENRNPQKVVTFVEIKDGKVVLKEKFQ